VISPADAHACAWLLDCTALRRLRLTGQAQMPARFGRLPRAPAAIPQRRRRRERILAFPVFWQSPGGAWPDEAESSTLCYFLMW